MENKMENTKRKPYAVKSPSRGGVRAGAGRPKGTVDKFKVLHAENFSINQELFNLNPKLFMNFLVGSLTINCINNSEADRLELKFGRNFIKEILNKSAWTWEDYETIYNCCI